MTSGHKHNTHLDHLISPADAEVGGLELGSIENLLSHQMDVIMEQNINGKTMLHCGFHCKVSEHFGLFFIHRSFNTPNVSVARSWLGITNITE